MPWDGNKLIHISSLTAAHAQSRSSSLRVASVPPTILYTFVFINTLAVSGTDSLGMAMINSYKCSLTTAHAQSSLTVNLPGKFLRCLCPSARNADRACEEPASEPKGTACGNLFAGCGVILCKPVHSSDRSEDGRLRSTAQQE